MIELIRKFISLVFVSVFLFSAMVGVRAQSVHDVAVVDVCSKSKLTVNWGLPIVVVFPVGGWLVYINVTAENQGDFYENFTVTIYYDNNTIETQSVVNLAPGTNKTLTFVWFTNSAEPCTYNYTANEYIPYTLYANASVVEGETDTEDNVYVDGPVIVRIPGDYNGDGHVSGLDLVMLGKSWYYQEYGDPYYSWKADGNGDGKITGLDLIVLGKNWYKY